MNELIIERIIERFNWQEVLPLLQDHYPQAFTLHLGSIDKAKDCARELLRMLIDSNEVNKDIDSVEKCGLVAYYESFDDDDFYLGLKFEMACTTEPIDSPVNKDEI